VNAVMTEERRNALQRLLDEHRGTDGSLIQVLHAAQSTFGYLSDEVQAVVAEELGLPPSMVRGVVTFYSFFRTEPRGEHVISVCTGTACHVKGAERVLDILEQQLGVGVGDTTEDGRFTVQGVRCIGACGLAPVMMIDDEVYGKLTRERIGEILTGFE